MLGPRGRVGVVVAVALSVLSCGGASNQPAASAANERCSGTVDSEAGRPPVALPRYFALRVQEDDAWVGTERVRASEIDGRLARESANALNQGAALLIGPGTSSTAASRWFNRLLAAGFLHVVVSAEVAPGGPVATPVLPDMGSGGLTPRPEAPVVGAGSGTSTASTNTTGAAGAEPSAVTPPPPAAVAAPEAAEVQRVEVKQMGLHIGGGPNTPEEVARYSVPIAKRFGEFNACYRLAKGTRKAASFGVDLQVSSRGGRAKIKDFRTVLTGKDFLACMLDIFGTIEFSGPARDTVISYSLLFKPKAP